jgi:hypothetical protein
MEKFKICSLRINSRLITFNEGVNYIVGANGTGKTTLFYLIQYVLGLKTEKNLNNITFNEIALECRFGNKRVIFIRKYPSSIIQLSGDYEITVNVRDKALLEIYNKLFNPTFNIGRDEYAGIEILKMSFVSERLLLFNKRNIDIIKKILGLNVEQLKNYKENIESYKERSTAKNSTYDILKSFIAQVENSLRKENIKENELNLINSILNKEYLKIFESDVANKDLIQEATEAYQKLSSSIEKNFYEKLNLLENYYYNYKMRFELQTNKGLLDIYKGYNNNSSYGEEILLQVILLLILSNQDNSIVVNPISILVQDSIINILELRNAKNIRQAIEFECERNGLQYIEFSRFSDDISTNQVILNLNHEEVFKW